MSLLSRWLCKKSCNFAIVNKKKTIWNQLREVARVHLGLTVIIVAALLLELTTGVMYYEAQIIIQRTMKRLVEREMNAIYLCIRNKLAPVEVTLDNMAWVTTDDLANPDSLIATTRQLVEHNPEIHGSSVSCVPNYFPEKGRWYEPYSVRRADGTIESMQLGSASHDYTQMEFYTAPIAKGHGHWCEPYMDYDGARTMVTTYGVPVSNAKGETVAVVDADISLDWLNDVIIEGKVYQSTQRFLITRAGNMLAGKDNAYYRAALKELDADDDKVGYAAIKDEHGDKLHVFFHPVGGKTSWILISILNDNDVFGKLRHVRLFLLLMVLAGMVLAGFIVYRTSRNLERLRQVNAEKERIGGELRVASQIQQSMLPQEEVRGEWLEVRGSLVPAKEVGGDLYDYFIRDEKLFFCIGDVSGKGAASAMMMAVVQTKFRDFSAHENNPARIMQNINVGCCQNNKTNMFATLFIGVLDLPTGLLHYCNAGHDAPFVLNEELRIKNEEFATAIPVNPNLPVGVFDDFSYTVQETQIAPHSTLFLYTDGLTEAMNSQHKQFGLERVEEMLRHSKNLLPKDILERATTAVHHFVKDADQSDDLTMMAIHYTPHKNNNN